SRSFLGYLRGERTSFHSSAALLPIVILRSGATKDLADLAAVRRWSRRATGNPDEDPSLRMTEGRGNSRPGKNPPPPDRTFQPHPPLIHARYRAARPRPPEPRVRPRHPRPPPPHRRLPARPRHDRERGGLPPRRRHRPDVPRPLHVLRLEPARDE